MLCSRQMFFTVLPASCWFKMETICTFLIKRHGVRTIAARLTLISMAAFILCNRSFLLTYELIQLSWHE